MRLLHAALAACMIWLAAADGLTASSLASSKSIVDVREGETESLALQLTHELGANEDVVLRVIVPPTSAFTVEPLLRVIQGGPSAMDPVMFEVRGLPDGVFNDVTRSGTFLVEAMSTSSISAGFVAQSSVQVTVANADLDGIIASQAMLQQPSAAAAGLDEGSEASLSFLLLPVSAPDSSSPEANITAALVSDNGGLRAEPPTVAFWPAINDTSLAWARGALARVWALDDLVFDGPNHEDLLSVAVFRRAQSQYGYSSTFHFMLPGAAIHVGKDGGGEGLGRVQLPGPPAGEDDDARLPVAEGDALEMTFSLAGYSSKQPVTVSLTAERASLRHLSGAPGGAALVRRPGGAGTRIPNVSIFPDSFTFPAVTGLNVLVNASSARQALTRTFVVSITDAPEPSEGGLFWIVAKSTSSDTRMVGEAGRFLVPYNDVDAKGIVASLDRKRATPLRRPSPLSEGEPAVLSYRLMARPHGKHFSVGSKSLGPGRQLLARGSNDLDVAADGLALTVPGSTSVPPGEVKPGNAAASSLVGLSADYAEAPVRQLVRLSGSAAARATSEWETEATFLDDIFGDDPPMNDDDNEACAGCNASACNNSSLAGCGNETLSNVTLNSTMPIDYNQTDPTPNATASPVANATASPVPNATASPVPNATASPVANATASPVANATASPVANATASPVANATASPVPNATASPVPNATASPVANATASPVPNATASPVANATASPVANATASPVANATASPVANATASPVANATASPVANATASPVPNATSSATPLSICHQHSVAIGRGLTDCVCNILRDYHPDSIGIEHTERPTYVLADS
ncbi:hypothetical protein FNF27_06427 [Cafeteria roenbergensis]|uniref:Uncharacterized protein n=1 Tax=Cafeteria roenbergensis TaxID=33653 RepID=A0A5A8E4C4_CAFRO|nr:hypothetical protein FNF27_06427 [Cafeteria roenbergensis]